MISTVKSFAVAPRKLLLLGSVLLLASYVVWCFSISAEQTRLPNYTRISIAELDADLQYNPARLAGLDGRRVWITGGSLWHGRLTVHYEGTTDWGPSGICVGLAAAPGVALDVSDRRSYHPFGILRKSAAPSPFNQAFVLDVAGEADPMDVAARASPASALGYAGVVVLAWAVVVAVNRARRRILVARIPLGHCSVCGYDLRASAERCPECGAVIATERNIPHLASAALTAPASPSL